MKHNPPRPHCGGHATRNGLLKIKKEKSQKHLCTVCKHYFSTFSNTIFFEKAFPSQVVSPAVELKTQHGPSLNQTQSVLAHFTDNAPSTGTLSLWTNQLRNAELPSCEFDNVWHINEIFVRPEQRLPDGKRV